MKPKPNREQRERLAFLLQDGQWHIGKTLRIEGRMIRACCEAETGRFMSGQSGYKLVQFATNAEIQCGVADLRSRSKCLRQRAEGLELAYYRRTQPRQVTQQESLAW